MSSCHRILTVHNNPENLTPPPRFKHKRLILADVETEDVSKYFNESFTYIEEARAAHEGMLLRGPWLIHSVFLKCRKAYHTIYGRIQLIAMAFTQGLLIIQR